jgi:hypothetical protein
MRGATLLHLLLHLLLLLLLLLHLHLNFAGCSVWQRLLARSLRILPFNFQFSNPQVIDHKAAQKSPQFTKLRLACTDQTDLRPV